MIKKEKVKTFLKYTAPLHLATWELTEKAIDKVKNENYSELEEYMKREEFVHKLKMQQAKIEQELAISERIRTAETVEIEEVFDSKGNGSVGLGVTEGELNLGLKGSGQKMTKRIIRFIGFQEIEEFIEEENL
ncbi:hypothetical protein [Metabacillus litoralis]|uniref:hypothetical protein n=1 Tax=Metabacillus litoralis TaxID=152268 RepID=UPI001CFE5E83|nr:hypothetical protein [Metabacillus litoralis]